MTVNSNSESRHIETAPGLEADSLWLAQLEQAFERWRAWAIESKANRSASFRQTFADRWIELNLAERLIAAARATDATEPATRARQARAWTLRCIERLSIAIAQTKGDEAWMQDGLRYLRAGQLGPGGTDA